jgi:glycosyltransferase involved in cell wall biosynthesis
LFFVYPSLYEGFGLPILEAYKAECPIILSDTRCFREIARDAAEFFDPYSVDDLVRSMEKLIGNTGYGADLVKKGSSRMLDFPIEKSVAETLSVYDRVMNS